MHFNNFIHISVCFHSKSKMKENINFLSFIIYDLAARLIKSNIYLINHASHNYQFYIYVIHSESPQQHAGRDWKKKLRLPGAGEKSS